MNRPFLIFVLLLVSLTPAYAQRDHPAVQRSTALAFPASLSILPASFSGWQKKPGSRVIPSPAGADAPNAEVLTEYGFTDFESAAYQKDGRDLTVKAIRFADTNGAYGAFTFYRQPQMSAEKLCSEGASDATQVLFYCSNVLVQATLDRVTAMSGTQMRALADALPKGSGAAALSPTAPLFLPENLRHNVKYIVGPAAFAKIGSPVPEQIVDFTRSPEVAISRFSSRDGTGTAVVINYPTPKIAALQLKIAEDWNNASKSANSGSSSDPNAATTFVAKRSGPLVALVVGDLPQSTASDVLSKINYEADVTWSEPTFNGKRDNIGNLVVNILYLSFILIFFMFVISIAIGGMRLLERKFFPAREQARAQEAEFIRLKLND